MFRRKKLISLPTNKLLNSEEQPSLKICFCEAHYNQVFLISQCELCRNRSMHMVTLQKDKVREYQLILDEDCIPVTIQYDIFICKPCKFYILLRNDKTITITCELQKHIDAVITRIKNKNISITKGLERVQLTKNVINMKKKEENNQFLMVIFLSENVHNFFTANSSIPSQLVSSVLRLNAIKTLPPLVSSEIATVMESFTVSIVATALGTGLTTEKQIAALTKEKWDEKFTVENLTMSTFNRKKSILLYEIFSVPRTKNRELPSVKRTTPDHNPLYNKSFVFEQVPNPYLFEPNKCMKVLEPISPVKKPTQLQTNQSYQNKLDSPSTSSRTEFPELSRQRSDPTTLSSTTPDLIQLFENLKIPYSNGTDFIKHLLNLETCRCLGTLIVGNNKTTHRQRTSNTATTSPYIINCSPEHKELLSISHADDDDTDLKNYDCLSDKYVPSVNHNNSVSNFVPAKKTPKSCNIPKQKSDFPKIFINKPPQYHYSCASKNQTLIYLPRIKDILTFTDAAAVEKSATVYNTTALTMFKTVGSTSTDTGVSPAIDANSITPISRTANDDTTSIKIYTAITNAITTKSSISAKRFEQLSLLWRKIRRKSSIRKVKHPLKRLNHSRLILMNSKESITTLFCKPRTQRTIRRIG